jgi:hypothetical protein
MNTLTPKRTLLEATARACLNPSRRLPDGGRRMKAQRRRLRAPPSASMTCPKSAARSTQRYPFSYRYTEGFDVTGRLSGLQLRLASSCGFSADLSGPVVNCAIFHSDNACFLEDVEIGTHWSGDPE